MASIHLQALQYRRELCGDRAFFTFMQNATAPVDQLEIIAEAEMNTNRHVGTRVACERQQLLGLLIDTIR